jgi:hypothetical protein
MAKYDKAVTELEQTLREPNKSNFGWRRLREDSHGGDFIRRLDAQYTLQVQMLYADLN